jgi:hypothetical protein
MERGKPSDLSGGFGFTMSEEGGLDDVAEFFWAAANWERTRSSSVSSAATLVARAWHWGHLPDVELIVKK